MTGRFVRVLERMVTEPEYMSYIHFSSTEDSVIIESDTEFSELVLPNLLKCKYRSFIKQLHNHGFHTSTMKNPGGTERLEFWHDLFVKGASRAQLDKIVSKVVKRSTSEKHKVAKTSPDRDSAVTNLHLQIEDLKKLVVEKDIELDALKEENRRLEALLEKRDSSGMGEIISGFTEFHLGEPRSPNFYADHISPNLSPIDLGGSGGGLLKREDDKLLTNFFLSAEPLR